MFKPKPSGFCLLVIIFFFLFFSSLRAQYSLVGKALQTNPTTYRLTQDIQWQNGSVWNVNKIDLNNSFDIFFECYFGNHDDGADGITFTLQRQGTNAGGAGGGLGATGITPSLIVEYDTYQNTDYLDPVYDHIAIEKNGIADHSLPATLLAGPIQANVSNVDIENGQWHKARVKWDAATHTMEVYFDCTLRLTYNNDIIASVFGGNNMVYYGFTASTGGSTNEQSVRGFHFTHSKKMDAALCAGDSVQIDLSGDLTYSWQPTTGMNSASSPNPIFYPGANTQYIVDITGHCFETWKDTVNIAVNNKPSVNLGLDQSICEGSPALTFDAGNPGDSYLWSSGESSQSISKSSSGTYSVVVTDTNNCKSKDSVILTVIPKPVIDLGPDIGLCQGQSATINSDFTGGKLLWSTAETTPSIVVNTTSEIRLKAYYDSNCPVYDTVLITVSPFPFSNLFTDSVVCFDDIRSITLDAGNGAQHYLWDNGDSTSATIVTHEGTYTLTLINGTCSIKDTVVINEWCPYTLFVPNAFTPLNKDGNNDVFYAEGINIKDFHLLIFNRWGELIHESFDITEGWDGTYKGKPVQVDVYVWKIYWTEDKKKEKVGSVTVLH